MPFCICCGNKLTEEANFCPNCGFRAREESAPNDPFNCDCAPSDALFSAEEPPERIPDVLEDVSYREQAETALPERACVSRRVAVGGLCVVLSVLIVAAVLLGAFRLATTKASLGAFISGCDLSALPADTLIADAEGEIVEWLRTMLIRMDSTWECVSERALERYLDIYIKPFVAEKLGEFSEDFYTGRDRACISKKELTALLSSGRDYLASETGLALSEAQCAQIVSWLTASGLTDYADLQYWQWQYPDLFPTMRLLTSRWMIALFCAFALLAVCLIVNAAGCAEHALAALGATFTVTGAILTAVLACSLFSHIWMILCAQSAPAAFVLSALVRAGKMLYIGVLSVGIALLAARAIVVRVCRQKT